MSNSIETLQINKFKLTKPFLSASYANKLSNVRVLQKNIVYIIGLSSSIANKEVSNCL